MTLLLALPTLASCSSDEPAVEPAYSAGKILDATPRSLAAVAIKHIAGTARSENGYFSQYREPRSVEASVEYGVDPESGYAGRAYSVRISVRDTAGYTAEQRQFFSCGAYPSKQCEATKVKGGTLIFDWNDGGEEDPAEYAWTLVRKHEVVQVSYTGEHFHSDPRKLDLRLDPDDLRAVALDPSTSLRTTTTAVRAGRALKDYHGVETRPRKPVAVRVTAKEFLHDVVTGIGRHPTSTRPSTVTDFGLHPLSLHLEFPATASYDAYSADVFTAVGRTPLLDPPPCGIQKFHDRVQTHCYGRDKNNYRFWQPATAGKPGVEWIVKVSFNAALNRPESSAIRLESTALTSDFLLKDRGKVHFSRSVHERVDRMLGQLEPERSR